MKREFVVFSENDPLTVIRFGWNRINLTDVESYGYVKEITGRGTVIISVEYIMRVAELKKKIKCGLFNLGTKEVSVMNTVVVKLPKKVELEVTSKETRRVNKKKLLGRGVECNNRLLENIKDGCYPINNWTKEFLATYTGKEKTQ